MITPNTTGKLESRVGAPAIKAPVTTPTAGDPLGGDPGILHGGVMESLRTPGHEFSAAPYSMAAQGIGGTTRQFGGPRW